MKDDYESWAAKIKRLQAALGELRAAAGDAGVAPPTGEEWFELLERKLLPELDVPPLLVVAVVGGTNIGKSVVFNHLAGEEASGVSPLAAGTKHPVCLVPAGFDDAAVLTRRFDEFVLAPWQTSADPLSESTIDYMYWRVGLGVPPRLLLLDTPDIDSDVEVNWRRADGIRQAADVLIAVLTQQKYNDAAVKRFFRKAVEADKPVVVVFNQCELAEDRAYWPHWLATFCGQTGANPELIYVVPYDRQAAREMRLPFYEVGLHAAAPGESASLRDDLADLRFDAIKIRTFRGAVARLVDPARGVGGYLDRIRAACDGFTKAAGILSSSEMARVQWPSLPAELLVDELRDWWDAHRSGWSRRVHGFYRALGRGATWPVRVAWASLSGPRPDAVASFRQSERTAILLAVEKLLDELKRLAELGNDTLRPRLAALLTGQSRAHLLARVEASHALLPAVDDDYRRYLRAELDRWSAENPRAIFYLQSLDHAVALARPAITVSLVVSGWVLAGGLVHEAAVQAVAHTATGLATEAAVTGGITGGGEALVDATATGVRRAAARLFGQLQARYAQQRAAWLSQRLERELLGDLLLDLRRGAEAVQSSAFREVRQLVDDLASLG